MTNRPVHSGLLLSESYPQTASHTCMASSDHCGGLMLYIQGVLIGHMCSHHSHLNSHLVQTCEFLLYYFSHLSTLKISWGDSLCNTHQVFVFQPPFPWCSPPLEYHSVSPWDWDKLALSTRTLNHCDAGGGETTHWLMPDSMKWGFTFTAHGKAREHSQWAEMCGKMTVWS